MFGRKKIPRWGWPLIVVTGCFFAWLIADGMRVGVPAAGSAVRDGQFEFEVTNVEQGAKHVGGPGIFGDTAEGEFVVVHVHVSNIGKKESTFDASDQTMVDDEGNEYKGQGEVFGHKLNPGFESDELVAFDVPPGTTPDKFEFHDSSLSGGVKVKAK
jgi:hypothetical protein